MIKNVRKVPNRVYSYFQCAVCFDNFDAREEIYETVPEGRSVCYRCAEGAAADTLERIDRKIDGLNQSKRIITND